MELNKQAYEEYVKTITPKNSLAREMFRAFVTGGLICALGQCMTIAMTTYLDQKDGSE